MKHYPPFRTMSPAGQTSVVKEIFTTAHGRYDFLNHFLSLRRDVGWRSFAVEKMRFERTHRFLDVATGTADLAIAAAGAIPLISVTGIDFAAPMLEVGRRKVREEGLAERVQLLEADACALPFPDASFDVTAVAFGMRNIPDKARALREMARVTVPGGQVMVLEMTFAPAPAFRTVYGFYLRAVLPRSRASSPGTAAPTTTWRIRSGTFPPPAPCATSCGRRASAMSATTSLTFGAAIPAHRPRAPGGA